jgi:hypothetical protein
MKRYTFATLLAAVLLSGCATIVGDSKQNVQLNSTPEGAQVTITNQDGKRVSTGETPMSVTLETSAGYFDGEEYQVTFAKAGFEERTVTVSASPNGWYIAGNLLVGGFIGWLVVDPLTGAMYSLSPDEVSAELGQDGVAYDDSSDNATLHVTLISELPQHARAHLERIDVQ